MFPSFSEIPLNSQGKNASFLGEHFRKFPLSFRMMACRKERILAKVKGLKTSQLYLHFLGYKRKKQGKRGTEGEKRAGKWRRERRLGRTGKRGEDRKRVRGGRSSVCSWPQHHIAIAPQGLFSPSCLSSTHNFSALIHSRSCPGKASSPSSFSPLSFPILRLFDPEFFLSVLLFSSTFYLHVFLRSEYFIPKNF